MAGQLPPNLSYILNKLGESGRSFIKLYGRKEKRMHEIADKLNKTSEEVNKLQRIPFGFLICAVFLGLGIVFFALILFGHGLLSCEGAAKMTMMGITVSIGAGTLVIFAATRKEIGIVERIGTVEQLLREFVTSAGQLMGILEEISMVSDVLEKTSSSLMTRTGALAKTVLLNTKQLDLYLERAAELAEKYRAVMDQTIKSTVEEELRIIFNFHPVPKRNEELRNCMRFSALHCWITLNGFVKMRAALKDFEERQPEQNRSGSISWALFN